MRKRQAPESITTVIENSHLTKLPRTTNCTAVLHIKLPPHAVPGQPFDVFANNTILKVYAPPGFKAGDTVEIKVGAFPSAPRSTRNNEQENNDSTDTRPTQVEARSS